ncbi:MAG TPA: Calx-beta domain-containing protein, partial [Pirellulales bacterium]|nr:Calx-beta domain-containing protein [Pirellulales bacterium]
MSFASLLDLASRPAILRSKKRRRPARFFVELLENRALLATYTVNDPGPGLGGGAVVTLMEAIGLANAHPNDSGGADVINFNIPGGGVQTISPQMPLPEITDPVIIDGTTQDGYGPEQPMIVIDGSQAPGTNGLVFLVGGNTVEGLVIDNFSGFGVVLDGSNDAGHGQGPGLNNLIQSNFIGTDSSGRNAAPNGSGGIDVVHSSYNLIGGLDDSRRLLAGNLISGNNQTGIFLADQFDTHNYIEGNYIGTDVDGLKPLSSGSLSTDGIFLGPSTSSPSDGFASGNFIGNFDPRTNQFEPYGRNVIAGNNKNGVYILGGTGNLLSGNYIGIGSDGVTPIPNGEDGILLEDASSNTVGGAQAGAGNVISANNHNGLDIVATEKSENSVSMPVAKQSAVGNVVQGNYIGTDADASSDHHGPMPLGNGQDGVVLGNFARDPSVVVSLNLIGGDDASDGTLDSNVLARNIISGNLDNGVLMEGPGPVTVNTLQGDFIGTNKKGDQALPNVHTGVIFNAFLGLTGAPSSNLIGGSTAGAANVISGNGAADLPAGFLTGGVRFENGSNGNALENNLIGVDASGLKPLPNIGNGVTIDGSINNLVGGSDAAYGNVIGANTAAGVDISGQSATNNTVQENLICVGRDRTTRLGNALGIAIENGAAGNLIGGSRTSGTLAIILGNVVAANNGNGIQISSHATGNHIEANFIGTNDDGASGLGNVGDGVFLDQAIANLIGGAQRNYIAGNALNGVHISDTGAAAGGSATTTLNLVQGNFIGIRPDGATPLPNSQNGVFIDGGFFNSIGGNQQGSGNVISGNGLTGVRIEGNQTRGNVVEGDLIGTTADGNSAAPNGVFTDPSDSKASGVLIFSGATGNSVGAVGDFGRNVISGNRGGGVSVLKAGPNIIQNNYIGLNQSGTAPLLNQPIQSDGIFIANTPGMMIGGDTFALGGNVISGNTFDGILLDGSLTVGTQISGNDIGTNKAGDGAIGNARYGIIVTNDGQGAPSQTVMDGNIISGNLIGGLKLTDGAFGNQINGNYIGTNNQADLSIPNFGFGVEIDNSPNNTIAGNDIGYTEANPDPLPGFDPVEAEGNGVWIAGRASVVNTIFSNFIFSNEHDGVQISEMASGNLVARANVIQGNSTGVRIHGAIDNVVQANRIGLDVKGKPAGNAHFGVVLDGGGNNLIGTDGVDASSALANVISANQVGVYIINQSNGNTVAGNFIGTDPTGVFLAGYGNSFDGVEIGNSNSNVIGGETSSPGAAPGNVIKGNGVGIYLAATDGTNAQDNKVEGNNISISQGFNDSVIGVDLGSGISIAGATNTLIGGSAQADANTISFNSGDGIRVSSGTSNAIGGNRIFRNTLLGIRLEGGANNQQAPPTLSLATTGASHRIAGTISGAPNTRYIIQVFAGTTYQQADGSEDDDAEKLVDVELAVPPVAGVSIIEPFKSVTTNGSGVAVFDASLPDSTIAGTVLRATATDPSGNTSQFSKAVTVKTDTDGDGVSDDVENGSSTGGSQDASVASFQDALDPSEYLSLQAPSGVTLQNVWSIPNPSPIDAPRHTQFSLGFVDFTLGGISPGQHVAGTLTVPVALSGPFDYWRFGSTQQNSSPHWYAWNYDPATDTGAVINGNTITLHFVNGARGDDDLDPNNDTIVDAGSPGFADPFTVTTTADSGPGSLRQTILNANANPGTDEITFDIPGVAPHTIQLLSPLPAITDPANIDGFRLPSDGGSDQEGTTPQAELNGSQAGPNADGLTLEVGNSTVQGLIVDHFSGDGVRMESNGSVNLQEFYGNVVSGMTIDNNGGYGIEINDTALNTIGSLQPAGANEISGNAAGGVYIHGADANRNHLTNNFIGTQADGVTPLGNGGPGVLIGAGASDNSIGLDPAVNGNTIAFNVGAGVEVLQGDRNSIEGNSIFANRALGIDLGGDGVTPNHAGSASGPNELQNFPVLDSAASYGGRTFITGTLTSLPDANYTLDFYDGPSADASGYGQGQTWLGLVSLTTDDNGQASFDANFAKAAAIGSYITATASLGGDETSEFSAALRVNASAPLTLLVNTVDDVNDATPDPTHFSVREAIEAANSHPGQDFIRFDLPDQTRTITPLSALPTITDPVIIDGTSQPGFHGLPLVELDGSQAGRVDGLHITGGGSLVRGLVIHSFQYGIELSGLGGNRIEGNFIGTDVTGTGAMSEEIDVYVNVSPDNVIGGTTAAARNIIGSVDVNSYDADTNAINFNSGGNRIEGNYIGSDVTGTALLPASGVLNVRRGIHIDDSISNTIGGTDAGAGNLIEGGVFILDSFNNVVQGNLIGTDVTGTLLLSRNVTGGVEIAGGNQFNPALGNLIGGPTPAARNIIPAGLAIEGFAYQNSVQGNYIGTDVSGTVSLHDSSARTDNARDPGYYGIYIEGVVNTIGGTQPGEGNLISGNPGAGIYFAPSASGNILEGNRIGTDVTGTKALGNVGSGILSDGSNNTIGGVRAGSGNLISGNTGGGILLAGPGGDVVEGNLIGTDAAGTAALGNGFQGGGVLVEENNALIGAAQPGGGNVISGNRGNGVAVTAGGYFPSGIDIFGNKIGTDATGTSPLGNGGDGINISGSKNDVIGGVFPGGGNLISANGGDGIRILDLQGYVDNSHASTGTSIEANTIGADVTGTQRMGNGGDGISIITSNYLASNYTIGGANSGAGNLVAFNAGRGVTVPFGNGNTVRGNDIFANGDLGLMTDMNGAMATYAEPRGVSLLHIAPVLTSAVFEPDGALVSGTLSGTPLTRYEVDLFANDAVNPSGFGDGQTYLQSVSVLTDDSGTVQFQIPFDAAVPVGKWITATATADGPQANTSQFSQPVPVVAAIDASDVQFSAPTYVATENGGAAVVTVTRIGSTKGTATVDYATSDGSATAGSGYTVTSGTLVFNDGEASHTVTIPIRDNTLPDGNRTFQIVLTNAAGASLGSVSDAAVTIADDDKAGQIAFASSAFTVDRALAGPVFMLTRTGDDHGRVSVDFRVTGGTALPLVVSPGSGDLDYEDNFGTVTFEDGQTTAQISFTYVLDLLNNDFSTPVYRGPRTIEVTLGNPTGGATLGAVTTSVLTIDDEENQHGAFGFSTNLNSPTVNENDGQAQIDIFRAGQLSTTESVSYATLDGTAKAGTNYIAKSGVLTFQPGENEKIIYVPIIDDHVVDTPGSFQVLLSNPTGGAFIFDGLGTQSITIMDSDGPASGRLVVGAGSVQHGNTTYFLQDSAVEENTGSVVITVQRLDGSQGTITVDYATSDGTARSGVDYTAASGTLTFAPGQISKTFNVAVFPDDLVPGDKTFSVSLSNATGGATIDPISNPAVVTIYQDQGQFQLSANHVIVAEANAALTVTIALAGLFDPHPSQGGLTEGPDPAPPLYALSINYSTEDGTAHSGARYLPASGTLTFVPGQPATQTITIPILNNTPADGDQTFDVTLSSPTGGITLGANSTISVTVLDEDSSTSQTSTVVTSSFARGATYGHTVAFTAVVGASSGTPTGSVDFVDQTTGHDLGSAMLAFVNGVDEASVSAIGLTAGSHTIVAMYTSDTSGFEISQGVLAQLVNPATLTVMADDKSKIYGSADPPLTDAITGFVNGDTSNVVSGAASLSTPATLTSGVDNYSITAGLGTLSAANYIFAFANGALTVAPAKLTVTAGDKSKIYGSANPPLTDAITGFVNGDTSNVVSGAASL